MPKASTKSSKTPPVKQDRYLVPFNNLAKTLATTYAYSQNNPREALEAARKARGELKDIILHLKEDLEERDQ